jgi:hypothetical protein
MKNSVYYDGTFRAYIDIHDLVNRRAVKSSKDWENGLVATILVAGVEVKVGQSVLIDDLYKVWKVVEVVPPPPYNQSHPLLNPESKHYAMIGEVEAIELMEAMFTVEELKAWAKLTAIKYRLRIGGKDDPEKEIAKIKTFEAYWRYLNADK